MMHNVQWFCPQCNTEVYIEAGFSPGNCSCGLAMVQGCGEEYDQEFVEEEKYQRAKEEFDDRWQR